MLSGHLQYFDYSHIVTGPLDFIALPLTNVTFTPSNVSHTISVGIVDDGIFEGGELFVVQLHVINERVDILGPDNATVTIVDNDSEHSVFQLCFVRYIAGLQHTNTPLSSFAEGTVSLSSASYSVVEGGEVDITIELARVPGLDEVTVQLSTSDGTATGKSVQITWSDSRYPT